MVLSFAKVLKRHNINFQKYLLAEATDISETCVYMTYIQLSLYGVPAIVTCGNVLTQEVRFKMETPFYFLNYLKFRKRYRQNAKENNENNIDKPMEKQILFKETIVKGNCQITLW